MPRTTLPRNRSSRRGGVRRAIALWTLAAGAAWVAGKQIGSAFGTPLEKNSSRVHVEQHSVTQPSVGRSITEHIPIHLGKAQHRYPIFVQQFLEKKPYEGNIRTIQQNWERISNEARDFFTKREKETGKKYHPIPLKEVNQICAQVSSRTGVPAALIKAIFNQEAKFDPYAVSEAGAMGAGQLMPVALAELYQHSHAVRNPFDPAESLMGAATHFRSYIELAKRKTYAYEGKSVAFEQLPTRIQYMIALRAYNAGPGNTFTKGMRTKKGFDVEKIISNEYSQKVIALFETYQHEQ